MPSEQSNMPVQCARPSSATLLRSFEQNWARAAEDSMSRSAEIQLKFPPGSRIQVRPAAGPRLAGRTGTVIGAGYYPKSLRVILDGSKGPITLHMNFVAMVDT